MTQKRSDSVMRDVSWKEAIDCKLIYFTSTLGLKMDFGQSAESEVTPIAAACVAAQASADLLVLRDEWSCVRLMPNIADSRRNVRSLRPVQGKQD